MSKLIFAMIVFSVLGTIFWAIPINRQLKLVDMFIETAHTMQDSTRYFENKMDVRSSTDTFIFYSNKALYYNSETLRYLDSATKYNRVDKIINTPN